VTDLIETKQNICLKVHATACLQAVSISPRTSQPSY